MTRDIQARQKSERAGRQAEWLAALYLQHKGWKILDRRVQTGSGEIDLIATRGRILAFIEVKARATRTLGLSAVSPRQQDRFIRAGALWKAKHSALASFQPRYDLMVMVPWSWPVHIPGAFQASGRTAMDLS